MRPEDIRSGRSDPRHLLRHATGLSDSGREDRPGRPAGIATTVRQTTVAAARPDSRPARGEATRF